MISLTAEQKTIEGIFCTTTEMYVIPMYQRPYSWNMDQFSDLFRDLFEGWRGLNRLLAALTRSCISRRLFPFGDSFPGAGFVLIW